MKNFYRVEIYPQPSSPAPEVNEGLAKVKFYSEMAGAKNAMASGVRCTYYYLNVALNLSQLLSYVIR